MSIKKRGGCYNTDLVLKLVTHIAFLVAQN
jgi:hypothetical protein